jgi:hypothetical protein
VYFGDDPTCLVGEELNAVSFVMDYVEFHFNGPVLRALTNPVIVVRGKRFRFPEPGSRDALCSLIGEEMQSAQVVEDERVELNARDAVLLIPLDLESRIGPEAAHFVPARKDGTLRVEDMLIW